MDVLEYLTADYSHKMHMQRQKQRGHMEGSNTRERRPRPEQHCLPPPQPYPWLLYFHGKDFKNQTFCTISDPPKTYSRSIPELGASRLLTVQHGWCLLANSTATGSRLFLWNPRNLEKINLPPLKHEGTIGDCFLSSSPTATTNDQVCSIFLFSTHAPTIFYYCQLGDMRWRTIRGTGLSYPVHCNGRLYAQHHWYLVAIEELDLRGLKISYIRKFMPRLPRSRLDSTRQLVGSNDELFQVEVLHTQGGKVKVIDVAVHRFDFSLRVWEKVESIKDSVFFISSVGLPFACQAINPQTERGRIYIALGDNDFVYIYNIEDKSLMISQPFTKLPQKRSCPMWLFMPDVRMTDLLKETGDAATNEFALPLDMIQVIAKRLNVFDYLHFRATNRLFRLGAPPVQWRSFSAMSMSRFDYLSLSPLLVCVEKYDVLTFVHPKHGLKYKYTVNLPGVCHLKASYEISELEAEISELEAEFEICYSKDGWLLLRGNPYFSFFFNPFTKQVLPLAHGSPRNIRCVGFSHPPTCSECVIIELDRFGPFFEVIARITYLGEVQWHRFTFDDSNFPLDNTSPPFHRGAFYYLSQKGKLGVIRVSEEKEASWEQPERPLAPCTGYFNSFLVECNGNLVSVFEGPYGKWVRVFKLNESTMSWIKVESLENHMLFVGNTSFSAVASIPGMENKIYFPRFYGQSIVFYSLETNKYHTFESEVVNFHGVREPLNSSWIEPRWH